MSITIEEAIKLENPTEGVLSRHDNLSGPVDLATVKQAYWARCLNGTDPVTREPYKRFVANSMNLNNYEDQNRTMQIWTPESVDEDFNLVLSLCTDGRHRTLVDLDATTCDSIPVRLSGSRLYGISVVPSTSHWHIYSHHGVTFEKQLKALVGNEKYLDHTKCAGFASLRPPWIHKGWAEPVYYKSEFHGFEDSDWVTPVPESDGKVGWEELFGEG